MQGNKSFRWMQRPQFVLLINMYKVILLFVMAENTSDALEELCSVYSLNTQRIVLGISLVPDF